MENAVLDRPILIVDDEEDLLQLLDISLRKEGFTHIYLAKNGREALDIFKREAIDMALLDISLPDIDGYDICKTIRQSSDIPVLFLSARGDEMDRVIGLATGADDYS
ncbi:response regulator [Streptococcus ictaluri]|uniref:Transcriptional regulatory protein DltR n=1 Tax=Streptococcus ictaluri 707-05 TaxID=764299 RepID=G5JZE4_9STRE|nr:response regulator [Streptococcus ictaluri]EHI70906.1 response regulator receiver domain protein [Streptococcus ictaluri 707-05]